MLGGWGGGGVPRQVSSYFRRCSPSTLSLPKLARISLRSRLANVRLQHFPRRGRRRHLPSRAGPPVTLMPKFKRGARQQSCLRVRSE